MSRSSIQANTSHSAEKLGKAPHKFHFPGSTTRISGRDSPETSQISKISPKTREVLPGFP